MSEKDQKLFRSGIGTLMYMVKLTRPELSSSVREMSKVMDKGTVGQIKMLKRMINYAYESINMGINILPKRNQKWIIEVFADRDFCGNRECTMLSDE